MIKILTQRDASTEASLMDQMFAARASIFHERLAWAVSVDNGREIDRYDREEDPVYVVSVDGRGQATGSLRLLPTTGETMLQNEFAPMFDEPVDVSSPTVWECTRFCVHPRERELSGQEFRKVSAELLIGLCKLALESGIEQIVGLYDGRMTRIYRRIGWSPVPLASTQTNREALFVGTWDVSMAALQNMTSKLSGETDGSIAA